MTQPIPATFKVVATATVPLRDRTPIEDTSGKDVLWFLPDSVVITYVQERTSPGQVDEVRAPWAITAAVSGKLLTRGMAGKRRPTVTYRDGDIPPSVRDEVETFHPDKLLAA